MIKAVIIDDENKARELIESIIKNNYSNIEVCAKASSVIEGIKAINTHDPEIVFLDIEMQDGTGFDLLDALPNRNFSFMFVTAYNQYALKAFKYSAVDYITKPVDIDEFCQAVDNILENSHKKSESVILTLKENFESKIPLKLAVPSLKGYEYIKISEIIKFEADGRYTILTLTDNRKILASKSLGEFQDILEDSHFYKPHKSFLINLNYVKMYVKQDGGHILMEDNSSVSLSRAKKEEFLNLMNKLSYKL